MHICYYNHQLFASLLFSLQGLLSWFAGVEEAPDVFTWTGGGVIIGGIFLITYSEHTRERNGPIPHVSDPSDNQSREEEGGGGVEASSGKLERRTILQTEEDDDRVVFLDYSSNVNDDVESVVKYNDIEMIVLNAK